MSKPLATDVLRERIDALLAAAIDGEETCDLADDLLRDCLAALSPAAPQPSEQEATEAVAQWMLARSYATGHGDTVEDLLGELEAQAGERGAARAAGRVLSAITGRPYRDEF